MATWSQLLPASPGMLLTGVSSSQALTESGPPGPGDGLHLFGIIRVRPVLYAPTGQTFTGAGSLLAWFQDSLSFDPASPWDRFPEGDFTDLSAYAGRSVIHLAAMPVEYPHGRLALLSSGITLSSGSSVTLRMMGVVWRPN